MRIRETTIAGVFEIELSHSQDIRGSFVKMFHHDDFVSNGLATDFREQYYSWSQPKVLRGMHFQTPPHGYTKLVHCIVGNVLDIVVDLRVGSATFGRHARFELSGKVPRLLYIPPGIAHGFYVPTEDALLMYMVTTIYNPEHDAGIRWDSAGIDWPDHQPILSDRDKMFPALADFRSPFRFAGSSA